LLGPRLPQGDRNLSKTTLAIVALAAAVGSSPVLAGDLPSGTVSGPGYTLSATGGVIAFGLPAQGTGVQFNGNGSFDPTANTNAVGLQGGLSGAFQLSTSANYSLSLGVSVFGAMAGGSSTTTSNFSGQGTVVIPGYTTPVGVVSLTTGAGSATSAITGSGFDQNSGALTPVNLGSRTDALGVSQGPGGFSQITVGTTSSTGVATGALATTDGGIFVATGDLSGLKVNTKQTQSIIWGGADINLAATSDLDNGASVQAYVGPSYRYLGQHNTTAISATPPAVTNGATPASDLTMPTYTDTRVEDLNTNYLGGLGGVNYTTKVSDKVAVTVGGSVGLYSAWANLSGTETFGLSGGACPTTCAQPSGLPIASQTVTNANSVSGSWNGMAFSGGLNGGVTMAMTDKTSVTLGGNIDYLSAVPVVNHGATILASGGGTSGSATTSSGAAGAVPSITTGGMTSYGLTLSFNGHF
jgi:hypothetical protein